MTKTAENPSYSMGRLGWNRSIETLKVHLSAQGRSRVAKTLGFLAAALVSAEIGSQASVPDASDIFPHDEISAKTEIMSVAAAESRVSVVPKMPRSVPPAASQRAPLGLDIVMTTATSEALSLSGENVPSMMLMTRFSSMAPAAAATTTPVTPCAVTPKPKPKLKPKPPVQEPQTLQEEPQTKLSWWRQLPWLPLPWSR
jgi:hypothetical protein